MGKSELKHKDPTKIFYSMPVDSKYRKVIGENPEKLLKYRKDRIKLARKMKDYLKRKNRETMDLIKKEEEEERKILNEIPTTIFQDKEGKIRDHEGNIVNVSVSRYIIYRTPKSIAYKLTKRNLELQK